MPVRDNMLIDTDSQQQEAASRRMLWAGHFPRYGCAKPSSRVVIASSKAKAIHLPSTGPHINQPIQPTAQDVG